MNPTLALAARVHGHLAAEGVQCAIIGAVAMIAHGYERTTLDLDIATSVPLSKLEEVARRLRGDALDAVVRYPDDEDPLYGVIDVHAGEEADLVQVVNYSPSKLLGRVAIEGAESLPNLVIPVASLNHLIALKLYAWSGFHLNKPGRDILAMLEANPGIDMGALRRVCAEVRLDRLLDAFLTRFPPGTPQP